MSRDERRDIFQKINETSDGGLGAQAVCSRSRCSKSMGMRKSKGKVGAGLPRAGEGRRSRVRENPGIDRGRRAGRGRLVVTKDGSCWHNVILGGPNLVEDS